MILGFLMQGYGGCFNPPCRQRPKVLIRLISRAFMVCQPAMVFARHADDFGFYKQTLRCFAVRGSATETALGLLLLAILKASCVKAHECVWCVVTPTLTMPRYQKPTFHISLQALSLLTYGGFL